MGTAVKPHHSPKAPRDTDWKWSGTGHLDEIIETHGWDSVATAHAWYDPSADEEHDPPHRKTAYKMPHHVLVDGKLEVVWEGVTAAMTVINGARGDPPQANVGGYLAEIRQVASAFRPGGPRAG